MHDWIFFFLNKKVNYDVPLGCVREIKDKKGMFNINMINDIVLAKDGVIRRPC